MTSPVDREPLLLQSLAALVVKEGVGLGGLSARQRSLSLGLACCEVPADTPLRETDVNVALKQALAKTCRFMGTDHVELRRWLIDCGWLARDGFGREYRRVPPLDLPAELKEISITLASIDPSRWVEDLRASLHAQRGQRRQAWEARSSNGERSGASDERP